MIGRRVRGVGYAASDVIGIVERWEPLGHAMTDTLVREDSGRMCWYSSHSLVPADDLGPLPSRRETCERARREQLQSLRTIRAQHIAAYRTERWSGCEFGKAILGQALDAAIADLEKGGTTTE